MPSVSVSVRRPSVRMYTSVQTFLSRIYMYIDLKCDDRPTCRPRNRHLLYVSSITIIKPMQKEYPARTPSSVVCSGETDIHQLRLAMRIMVVCYQTLMSLSWFVLLTNGALGSGVGSDTFSLEDAFLHRTTRDLSLAKRFYEPAVATYSQLLKDQRPADLDFFDFLLGDQQKRAVDRHRHQQWDPQTDRVHFLIGHEMGGPSEWNQPLYRRTVPYDLRATMGGPQTVKSRPFYAYKEILLRRKRSKENSNAIDQWKNQKDVKGTGIKDGKSAIAKAISREGDSQSYGSSRSALPPSVDSTAQLDDESVATCKPQQLDLDPITLSGGMEKKEENGERSQFPIHRPSYDEFMHGEKRQTQKPRDDLQKPGAAKPPREMTYDEFLLGEKRNFQQQQQQSATGESDFGNRDKRFLHQRATDEYLLNDLRTADDVKLSDSLRPSGNRNRPIVPDA